VELFQNVIPEGQNFQYVILEEKMRREKAHSGRCFCKKHILADVFVKSTL